MPIFRIIVVGGSCKFSQASQEVCLWKGLGTRSFPEQCSLDASLLNSTGAHVWFQHVLTIVVRLKLLFANCVKSIKSTIMSTMVLTISVFKKNVKDKKLLFVCIFTITRLGG